MEGQISIFEMCEIEYIKIKKMEVKRKKFDITYRSLETIVETCIDYANYLEKLFEKEADSYKKQVYLYKAKENREIANKIAAEIEYDKSCNVKKVKDDIGGDALVLGANGFRR